MNSERGACFHGWFLGCGVNHWFLRENSGGLGSSNSTGERGMGYTVASSGVCVPEKDRLRLCRVGVDVGCGWRDGWLPCTVDLPRFVAPRSMVPTLAEST